MLRTPCILFFASCVVGSGLSGCMTSSRETSTYTSQSSREKICAFVRTTALLGPNRSGSFGEGFANAAAAYANCMAGLPVTPASRPKTMSCRRDFGIGRTVTCIEI